MRLSSIETVFAPKTILSKRCGQDFRIQIFYLACPTGLFCWDVNGGRVPCLVLWSTAMM